MENYGVWKVSFRFRRVKMVVPFFGADTYIDVNFGHIPFGSPPVSKIPRL